MNTGEGVLSRLALVGVAACLAVAAGGCGSDDDGDSSAKQPADSGAQPAVPANASPEEEIKAVYKTYGSAMRKQDAAGACATLTSAAQDLLDPKDECVAAMKRIYTRGSASKNEPFIVKLKVKGNRAQAQVKNKTSQLYPVGFAKVDGEWKLDAQGSTP